MALKYSSKEAEEKSFTLLPEGEYEVFISEIDKPTRSSNGNEMIVVNYTVRDDIPGQEQYSGQKVRFDRFVNTDKALWRFHTLNKALNTPEGMEFEDFGEWREYLLGKAVRLVVAHEEAEFGKNAGKIFPVANGFKESIAGGEMKIERKNDDPFDNGGSIDISDDDLPF